MNNQSSAENLLTAYRNLNEFLCAFINHSLPGLNYDIRSRRFFEKILDYDFQSPRVTDLSDDSNILFVGKSNEIVK